MLVENEYSNTAIVLGSLKEALLHFDYVIPMNFTGELMGLRPPSNGRTGTVNIFKDAGLDDFREADEVFWKPDTLMKLYPPNLANNALFRDTMNLFDGVLFRYMIEEAHGKEFLKKYMASLSELTGASNSGQDGLLAPTSALLQQLFTMITKGYQLENVPVDCSAFTRLNGDEFVPPSGLLATQILSIDTEKISYSQIMEFRKDSVAMGKMRNFRLFAYQEYAGKNRAFIEDDIQKKYADYCEVLKSSRFETKIKTLSFLFERICRENPISYMDDIRRNLLPP